MIRGILFLLSGVAFLLGACASAQDDSFALSETKENAVQEEAAPEALAKTLDEYRVRYQSGGATPEGAVKLYFDAVFCYMDKTRRPEAVLMLGYAMGAKGGWEKSPAYRLFIERMNEPATQHIFRSFAEGAVPANGYAMNPERYRLRIAGVTELSGFTQVGLKSSGVQSERIVHVRKFADGLWHVVNNVGTFINVPAPQKKDESAPLPAGTGV